MTVDPEEERCKCARVHDTQAVRLARLEGQGRVLVEADLGSDRIRVGAGNGPKICSVLGKVHEGRVCPYG